MESLTEDCITLRGWLTLSGHESKTPQLDFLLDDFEINVTLTLFW